MTDSPERSIARRLIELALPVIGLNLLSVLTLVVDTAVCGRLPDSEDALVALGFATQVVFLLMVAMMGLVVGAVAVAARAHGVGDHARVDHLVSQATGLTILVAVAVAGLGNLAAGPILSGLGAQGAVHGLALDYLRPSLTGCVFYYLNTLLIGVLRGVGNTRLAFLVALLSNALNVVLDYGLVLGELGLPGLGVTGAALATVASQAFAVVTIVAVVRRGGVSDLTFPLVPRGGFDRALASELWKVGAPAAADMVILNVSFMAIVGMLGHLDALAVAAHGVGLRIQGLAFVPGMSISQATAAMVGQALGASDEKEARAVVRASVVLCTVVMSVLAVPILAGAGPIVGIFDVEPSTPLGALSIVWIQVLGWGMPLVGVHIALLGMLRGAGVTNTGLWINLASTVGFQVPLSWWLGFPAGLGAFGVWLAFPLGFGVRALLEGLYYRSGRWAKLGAGV